jgi:hypothetical protein
MTEKQLARLAERLCKVNIDIMNSVTGKEFLEYIWENDRDTASVIIDFSVGLIAEAVGLYPESKDRVIKFIETKKR